MKPKDGLGLIYKAEDEKVVVGEETIKRRLLVEEEINQIRGIVRRDGRLRNPR